MSIDAAILTAMRQSPNQSISGAELASHLGISRAAIWARIDEMRTLGYDIQAGPHFGYRLVSTPDLLHADDLYSRISGSVKRIGREIQVYEQTTSTNLLVEQQGQIGTKEGLVIVAESQTRGRGRLGRRWISPKRKGLWFSALLRPSLQPQQVTQLTVAAAVAVARAVEKHCPSGVRIKWPNDILINNKKAAGILTELSAEVDGVKFAVLGIGVDVNQSVSDFPDEIQDIATSLRIAVGHPIDRPELAADMMRELDAIYSRILAHQFESVAAEWESRCSTLGRDVEILTGDKKVSGRAEALDSDGGLLVRTQHGRLERIVGGDVTVRM